MKAFLALWSVVIVATVLLTFGVWGLNIVAVWLSVMLVGIEVVIAATIFIAWASYVYPDEIPEWVVPGILASSVFAAGLKGVTFLAHWVVS